MKSIVYFLTRAYVRIALKFFYREHRVTGLDNIPIDKPVVFAPNHQNSFMDAILVACAVSRPIYYLVRASVFRSGIARWCLGLYNMMPIYRFRDGLKAVKKNEVIISHCASLLHKKKWLLLFPEGNHSLNYSIRPLQKGISRIVFQAIERYGSEVRVVPVGLYYEAHTDFRSRVLINFGHAIDVKDYYRAYMEDNHLGFRLLGERLSDTMKELTLHISPGDQYYKVYEKWRNSRPHRHKIIDQFITDQKIISALHQGIEPAGKEGSTRKQSLLHWLLFIPYLYGVAHHVCAYKLMDIVMKKAVTDIHFHSSIKLTVGMAIVPITYIAQAVVLYYMGVGWEWLAAYLISLPPSGLFAYWYHMRYFKYRMN